MSDVTRIMAQIEQGDPQAVERLLPLVDDELRKLAAAKAAVHAALPYYHDHRQQIDEQMEQGQALVEELKRQFPSKLQSKLELRDRLLPSTIALGRLGSQ